jgi:hypothetical protein
MNYDLTLKRLSRSKFRSTFRLSEKDKELINNKGIETIKEHAYDILEKRIKTKQRNDGRQTPFKGHPVFIAQHATATCCRNCIEKWHGFNKNKELINEELKEIVTLIMCWIEMQVRKV